MTQPNLPVDAVMPDIVGQLARHGRLVLQAPPGSGKTTRVPLGLMDHGPDHGRILMLEPRRIAARSAAERLAAQLGERPGARVGYRMRGDSRPGTRIEVVTEGILTRMIQSDPELAGIGCIIFDEFHERSLQADLGLALSLDIAGSIRPDLRLMVMSATLDSGPVAALMGDAPVVTAAGESFPVETRWIDRPWDGPGTGWTDFVRRAAMLTEQALGETSGGILVFLPGEGEIRALAARVTSSLPPDTTLLPLYGNLPFADQQRALRPLEAGRKLVLATAIAETSLTIPDISVVVDGGRARRARFDPASGMARLVTERVTRAEADQRRGRAGRTGPGICYRMWTKGAEGGLIAFPPPEIASADLAPLALDLAAWGSADLPFLTPPPAAALAEARALLRQLGALDRDGRPTSHGRRLSDIPAHPRLAHMLAGGGGPLAVDLAALLEGRGPPRSDDPGTADIGPRLDALRRQGGDRNLAEARRRLAPHAGPDRGLDAGALLSLAYPDRIGQRRPSTAPRYLLSGGKGALLDRNDSLAGSSMLVAADLDGDPTEATIRLAAPVDEATIRSLHADRIAEARLCTWSRRDGRVIAVLRRTLGALVLDERPWADADPDAIAGAMLDGIRDAGLRALPWAPAARRLAERACWARAQGADLPDMTDGGLMADLDLWLRPWLGSARSLADLSRIDLAAALRARLGADGERRLDRLAPDSITAPTGTRLQIDYSGEKPSVSVRLQEMFGTTIHPTVGPHRVPLSVELLSPARRPVQTTSDLPRFWISSYADVRKDMRGQYPRHPWPEDPRLASPTTRAKPRGV
jgi:ATP-dependent helicase HrpB